MLTITEQIPDFDTYEDYLGYCSEAALFFDIETTGLSAATSIVFLIGAVKRCGDGWQLTQWLAQCPEDEPLLLQAFFDAAADCDTLIHFNGATFDLPFIRERARRVCHASPESLQPEGMDASSEHLRTRNMDASPDLNSESMVAALEEHGLWCKGSLDLYQKFRPLKRPLGLSRMNQTTLEQFLGWQREDRLSGKHMISLFQKYSASREPKLGELLLLHNHDDLLGMTDLLRLCAYSMLFEGQTAAVQAAISSEDSRVCIKLLLTLKSALPLGITLSAPCAFPQSGNPENADIYYALDASGTQAVLSIPGFWGELRHFFPNYRDYYYLPLEDQVIHKSVGAFVDKAYRTPATSANCCIKKSGLFFPQPEEFFSPAFKPTYESKKMFFCVPESQTAALPDHMPGQGQEPESPDYPKSAPTETALALDAEKLTVYAASLLRMFAHIS